jgi:hypothetical protein
MVSQSAMVAPSDGAGDAGLPSDLVLALGLAAARTLLPPAAGEIITGKR